MIDDAQITAWWPKTGEKGRGEPVFGADLIAVAIPCQVVAPSEFVVANERAQRIRYDRKLVVASTALAAQGVEPAAGDRLSVALYTANADPFVADVVAVETGGLGDDTTVKLVQRRDGVVTEDA